MIRVRPVAGCSRGCRAPLAPHTAEPCPDINTDHRLRRQRVGNSFGSCCGAPSEQRQDGVGQEPRAWGDRVAAAEAMLVGGEEPQRLNQMEILLSTGHGDIKQTALFLDLRRIAGGNCRTRKPARASRGFPAQRRIASRSLTCAASINVSPPYLTNGMLRSASSISSRPLWCEVPNKTAWW